MADETKPPVPAELVMRLRQITDQPVMACKQYLETLSPDERQRVLEAPTGRGGFFHDPIEDDPAVRPVFLAVLEEATREVEAWHRERVAELERTAPAVAVLSRSGRGLCHRIWFRTKELLKERHGIDWRSPRELNPWAVFD